MNTRPMANTFYSKSFDIVKEKVPFGLIDLNTFNSSTFRGRIIDQRFVSDVLKESGASIGFRAVPDEELTNRISNTLLGLLWNSDFPTYDICSRNKKITENEFLESSNDDQENKDTNLRGFCFTDFVYPNKYDVIAVDYKNIPDYLQVKPKGGTKQLFLPNSSRVISAIPAWAILMKITKNETKLRADINPLYVDQTILSPELKIELDALSAEFYKICPLAKENVNCPELAAFRNNFKKFYANFAIEAKHGKNHIDAVRKEIEQSIESDGEYPHSYGLVRKS